MIIQQILTTMMHLPSSLREDDQMNDRQKKCHRCCAFPHHLEEDYETNDHAFHPGQGRRDECLQYHGGWLEYPQQGEDQREEEAKGYITQKIVICQGSEEIQTVKMKSQCWIYGTLTEDHKRPGEEAMNLLIVPCQPGL
jgi:hypothetical protein